MNTELPEGWSTRNIFDGESFDDLFQIEGIPLSWFYQRFFLPHVVPKPLNTFQKILMEEKLNAVQKIRLAVTARLLPRFLYYNERQKCPALALRMSGASERASPPFSTLPPKRALFLSYLGHVRNGRIYRFQGIIDALRQGKVLEPYAVLADKLSSKKRNMNREDIENIKSINKGDTSKVSTIYRYINERLSRSAQHRAAALHHQWKKLDRRALKRLLGDDPEHLALWPYLQYAFSFYLSKEFLYLTILYYYTMKEIIEQENVAIVITTAQNSLFERCCFAAAKNKNIPALFIQHGMGRLSRPEKNFLDNTYLAVFGPYTQQQLLSAGMRPERVIITGPVVYDEIVPLLHQPARRESILITTQPLVEDLLLSPRDYFTAVEKVVQACLPLNRPIHIKLHPRETNFTDYGKIERQDQRVKVHRHQSSEQLYRLLHQAALMINFRFSTTMLEAAILGVPVVTIPLCREQPTYFKGVDPSLHLTLNHDLTRNLQEAISFPEREKSKREEVIRRCFGRIDGQSSQRAADLIVRLGLL